MNFTLTINLGEPTLAALRALRALAGELPRIDSTPLPTIEPKSWPRIEADPILAEKARAEVFANTTSLDVGGAPNMIPGTHAGVTPGNAAPSAADAAPSANAPEGQQAGVPLPPSAASSSVPQPDHAVDAPSAASGPAPDVDSAGLPWDGRIHSESKATVADGTWRKRRNTPPETVAAVEAELRGLLTPVADVPAPPASAIPLPPAAAPATDTVPTPPPAGPVDTAGAAAAFEAFFKPYVAAMQSGRVTSANVDEALRELGIPTVMVLKQKPDLIPQFKALMGLD